MGMAEVPVPPRAGARPPITAADLASVSSLRLRLLLAGSGDPVRWAHSTELLDLVPYLRGGELVCTVGVALVDEAACRAFTAALAEAGALGVCFGEGDVHPAVPEALVAGCVQHDLALLVAERGVPFVAISEHLAQHRVEAAVAAERVGQLLDLVGDALASPEALLPALLDADLAHRALVVSAWPLDAAASALVEPPVLLAATTAVAYLVTADRPGAGLAAVASSLPHGVSRPVRWRELGTAVREARAGLARARSATPPGGPAAAPSLETLAAELSPEQLRPFVERLVHPLLRTGRHHDDDLVATLRDYLRLDGSLVETARARYLHVNSVRHRLERITALTGTDPTTLAGSAAFAIALRAHERAAEGPGVW